jgi:hypothetical protein
MHGFSEEAWEEARRLGLAVKTRWAVLDRGGHSHVHPVPQRFFEEEE